jgi:hypothetical protein
MYVIRLADEDSSSFENLMVNSFHPPHHHFSIKGFSEGPFVLSCGTFNLPN